MYGFDEVQHHGICYITESIFDKNSIGLGALASGGAILTDNQCKKLKMSAPKQIILAPDNDKAGIQSVIANYNRLRSYFDDLVYVLPPTKCDGKDIKDWNEISEDFLNDKYLEIINKEWNLDKLKIGYWTDFIKNKIENE